MRLYELLDGITKTNIPDKEITFITDNSAKVIKDCIFVCVKGKSFDGHSVAGDMLEKGAYAVVTDHDLGLGNQIITSDTREFYGKLCSAWFGHPERKMTFIGVTGTNGKTTMTNVIKHILTENGHKAGLVGTIQNEIGDNVYHTENTTPMAFELMELFSRMADENCDTVVMEVSSFGLAQKRIGTVHFRGAVFTNLTQDHLDYHKDMEDYFSAKKKLFEICDFAVCNIDDEYGRRLYNEIECKKYSYSVKSRADIYADVVKLKADETTFWYCQNGKSYNVSMKMTGLFNVANVSGAIAVCSELGIPIENILSAIAEYRGVKGRCEVIPTGKDFSVICDYAHTPDALENILKSVREYTEGRLVCLFGCGGNRDSSKRPLMAKAAAQYADKLIITSDNPRNEKPEAIIDDILSGLSENGIAYDVVIDRREAIYHALKTAKKGDVIILAGKGHEDYQILADNVHIHFDEREIVADGLKLL